MVPKTRFDICKSVSVALLPTWAGELTWEVTVKQDEAESHGAKNHVFEESAACGIWIMKQPTVIEMDPVLSDM